MGWDKALTSSFVFLHLPPEISPQKASVRKLQRAHDKLNESKGFPFILQVGSSQSPTLTQGSLFNSLGFNFLPCQVRVRNPGLAMSQEKS